MDRCRTRHDFYQQFAIHDPQAYRNIDHPFSQYWIDLHRPLAETYRIFGFHIFPLPKHSKRPFKDSHFTDCKEHLKGDDQLLSYVSKGCNLAVHLGHSNLVAIDFDNPGDIGDKMIDKFSNLTLTIHTPRGLTLLTEGPDDPDLNKELYSWYEKQGIDTIRTGDMYTLLPLSETCTKSTDKYGECNHQGRHDYRIREFLGRRRRVQSYSFIGLELLKVGGWNPR